MGGLEAENRRLRDLLRRALPVIGSHGRGFAQELLAEVALAVESNPYDWTAHPETLTRRIALLPKKQQKLLERRRTTPLRRRASDDSCRCNEQAREIGGEALRRVEAEQGRLDDARREP